MAKAKEETKELATQQDETGMTAADFGGGLQVQGDEDKTPQLSRVALYQGTSEEEEMYGEHKRGVFIDALECRELGTEIKIMPVFAWRSWAKFEPGSSRPVYSTANKSEVPPEDLEWDDDSKTPPAATESVNVVIVVDGEAWPYLMVFKRTGLKAFEKVISPVEKRRGMTNQTPGMYTLTSVDDKSGDGKPYKRLTARALGNPTPEMASLAKTIFNSMSAVKDKAETMAEETVSESGQDPPF